VGLLLYSVHLEPHH